MPVEAIPQLGEDGKILEGVVTTLNEDGTVNISPMGPIVDAVCKVLVLRPFQTSTTYRNLSRTKQGVFHVTDDVGLIARAAVGAPSPLPRLVPAQKVEGMALADACRWYEFRIESIDAREQRTTLIGKTISQVRNRDFAGFNRAQFAVVEAAILASRCHLLPAEEIADEIRRLGVVVQKTAGREELAAFEFLANYVDAQQTVCPETP